jgi:hypothetical protein
MRDVRRGRAFTGFWFGGRNRRDHWEVLEVGGRITFRWTLRRQESLAEMDSAQSD